MPLRLTKAKAAWREKVNAFRESAPGSTIYGFQNYAGATLKKSELVKLLTSGASAWNDFKRKQENSIIWYETDAGSYWLPGYIIDLRNVTLRKAVLTDTQRKTASLLNDFAINWQIAEYAAGSPQGTCPLGHQPEM
jgi:hypothetical protein